MAEITFLGHGLLLVCVLMFASGMCVGYFAGYHYGCSSLTYLAYLKQQLWEHTWVIWHTNDDLRGYVHQSAPMGMAMIAQYMWNRRRARALDV